MLQFSSQKHNFLPLKDQQLNPRHAMSWNVYYICMFMFLDHMLVSWLCSGEMWPKTIKDTNRQNQSWPNSFKDMSK